MHVVSLEKYFDNIMDIAIPLWLILIYCMYYLIIIYCMYYLIIIYCVYFCIFKTSNTSNASFYNLSKNQQMERMYMDQYVRC